jgi:hypothetical protein
MKIAPLALAFLRFACDPRNDPRSVGRAAKVFRARQAAIPAPDPVPRTRQVRRQNERLRAKGRA